MKMRPTLLNNKRRTRLVWHRKGDLRLHDNELYQQQSGKDETSIISLFVINPRDFKPRPLSFHSNNKTNAGDGDGDDDSTLFTVTEGPFASRALVDALTDLRHNLQALGGELVLRRGDPLEIIPEMAQVLQVDEVVWSEVPGYYERVISDELKNYFILGQPQQMICVTTVATYFLFHPDDLPRSEDEWSKLARPNEKHSKKKKSTVHNNAESTQSLLTGELQFTNHELVECTNPQRWKGIPRIMGDFRRAARTAAKVRPCLLPPTQGCIEKYPFIDKDGNDVVLESLPTVEELTNDYNVDGTPLLGLPQEFVVKMIDAACNRDVTGISNYCGETEARRHWVYFLHQHAATADRALADTSNQQSAHTSIALSLGTLSPRYIYHSVNEMKASKDCQWVQSHMEMRDYFLYSALAANQRLYSLNGQPVHKQKQRKKNGKTLVEKEVPSLCWKCPTKVKEHSLFVRWAIGNTGLPLIDAGMHELTTTGYCSNRVRQNMASVLTKDLNLDWRIGAEWFQFSLSDHCVAANYGNWQYFGGIGGDPKNRHFRTVSQAFKYDPEAKYVRKWQSYRREVLDQLQLKETDEPEIWFRPWDFLTDWPTIIVDPDTQYTWQDKQRLVETGRVI